MKRLALILVLLASRLNAATVTHEIITADSGNTPNTSGAFTPALNDLLVVCAVGSVTGAATATMVSSVGGFTFTQILNVPYAADVNMMYCFVSNALVSSATSQTVEFAPQGDIANGSVIAVEAVAGITRTGLNAILQNANQANQAASTTPAPSFASSALTGNPTIGFVANNSNPAGLTGPSGWTEAGDTGYTLPTTGAEIVFRNSGFTGTTITWGSTSATVFGSIILEIDTSSPLSCNHALTLLGAGCS